MSDTDIISLDSTETVDGNPVMQGGQPVSDDPNDREPSDPEYMNALGVVAVPFPANQDGEAEGVVLRNCGGRDEVCVGGRDARVAEMTGNLKPGDTAVISTHENQSSQLLLKGEKRQATLATRNDSGTQLMIVLDGAGDKIQITCQGGMFQISDKEGVSLKDKTGAGFTIKDGNCTFHCKNLSLSPTPKGPVATGPGPANVVAPGVFA